MKKSLPACCLLVGDQVEKDPIELSLPTRKQQRERQGLINVNSPQNYKTGMTLQDKNCQK